MAPVTWNRGPWASPQPYQYLQEQQAASQVRQRPQPYQSLIDPNAEGYGSSVGTGVTGPDVSGPMTSAERSTYGMVSDPIGYGINSAMDAMGARSAARDTLGTTFGDVVAGAPAMAGRQLASSAVPGYGLATATMKTPGIMESVMQMLGIQPAERNIQGPTAAEMQGLADRYGYDQPTQYGQSPSTNVGGVDMGGTIGGGLAGFGQAPGDTRDQTGESGGPTGGNSDTSGTADSTGGSKGGEGPGLKRGGVRKTKPGRSMTRTFGERGPEKAIFIPERGSQFDMTKPGIQGNERQVRRGLKSAYSSLTGEGR